MAKVVTNEISSIIEFRITLQTFTRKRLPCLYLKTGCYYHSCCIEHVELDTKSIAKDHGQRPATSTRTTEFRDIPARWFWKFRCGSGAVLDGSGEFGAGSGAVADGCGRAESCRSTGLGSGVVPYSSGGTTVW